MLNPPAAAGQHGALADLGRSLRAFGYTATGLADALGSPGPLVEGSTFGDRRRRARRAGGLGALARLLLMSETVPWEECQSVPAPLLSTLLDTGLLADESGDLGATVCLVPHDDLLVAADAPGSGAGGNLVPGVQPPSYLLGCLTIRLPVERALDLGTGCGIQALLLSSMAVEVIATDVSERALQFAELNAALNDRTNISFRLGDLFDPVKGDTFGLIVANPPYVISPDTVFTYRDSARGGEQVGAEVVEGAGNHLVPGGHATVLVSWDASGPDPLERPRSWVPAGCDALVLGSGRDVERNAELWNIGPGRDEAVDRWLAYFEQQQITQVGYGAVVLRRRDRDRPLIRSIEIGDQFDRPAWRHLVRLLDARDVDAGDRVRMVGAARVVERRRLEGATWVTEDQELLVVDGLGFRVTLDERDAALVESLDGRALTGLSTADLELVDRLVALGYAEILDP